jgi:FkbM family methyltransferase
MRQLLQGFKDFAIAHGMEGWTRPIWNRMVGKEVDLDHDWTCALIRRYLHVDSVCVDVGCHKGLILDVMIDQCPLGRFHAFEPIPTLAALLRSKYRRQAKVSVHELALASEAGLVDFFVDVDVLGRSGLRDTSDDREIHKTLKCLVQQVAMDSVVPIAQVDFVKIDVEGAELGVLQGASEIYGKHTPLTVFEHTKFGACHFQTKPHEIFQFFSKYDMTVSTLSALLSDKRGFTESEFVSAFYNGTYANFVAYHPKRLGSAGNL